MGSWVTPLITIAVIGWYVFVLPPCHTSKLLSRRNTTFTWTTGRWGVCYSYEDKCGKGEKERHVYCSDSEGFRALEPNCDINEKPPTVTSCFRVCDEHKNYLRWKMGEWGPCQLTDSSQKSDICRDTTGRAKRTVTCVYTPSDDLIETVEGEACSRFETKPEDSMACSKDCPQDCIVTDFQSWTSCNGCEAVVRTRSRIVLAAPDPEGESCPPLSMRLACSNMAACLQHPFQDREYLLRIGKWSPCMPPTKTERVLKDYQHQPVIGKRVRNVTCLTDEGEITDLSHCQHQNSEVFETENCVVPVDCLVSPWSEWSIQVEGCITSEGHVVPEIRTRSRQLLCLPEGDGQPCPLLNDKRIISNNLPDCDKYYWALSEWSDCIITHQKKILKPYCGGGVQLRNVTCLRSTDHVPVELSFCKESKPFTIQRCVINCPRNCVISEWSEWSPCLPQNRTDFFQGPGEGHKIRSRTVLIEPTQDGEQCPPLYESDPCDNSQIVYWIYGDWGSCVLQNPQNECGEGIRTRERKCIKIDGSLATDAICSLHLPTEDTTACYIPCPGDCVVSEWSLWSKCSVPCTDNHAGGEHIRNRTILSPNNANGRACPSKLFEDDICNQDSCHGFKWTPLQWSNCTVKGTDLCGEGVQIRRVLCTPHNRDDVSVPAKKCNIIPRPVSQRSCILPCPIDCIVTKFSEWSSCPDNCLNETYQYRKRYILQKEKFGGIPCPTELEERRLCWRRNDHYCLKKSASNKIYNWKTGEWSPCILPKHKCGNGFQIRAVSCVQQEGQEVEPGFCLNSSSVINDQVPLRSRKCLISCDTMCEVSEWSEWSSCENICLSKRNRTRELLPGKQSEKCKHEFPIVEEESCPLPMDLSMMGSHWQECIVDDDASNVTVNGNSVIGKCGTGRKYRQADGFDMKNCHQIGLQDDFCVVDCPRDCKFAAWSSWTFDNHTCGNTYRYRKRRVIHSANKFGRPCFNVQNGIEIESEVYNVSCNPYVWRTEDWTQCTTNRGYGLGEQHRLIRCVKNTGEKYPPDVDSRHCNSVDKPTTSRECYLFCPEDCIVSEWSQWSECNKTCSSLYRRKRSRTILRQKSVGGKPCPSLTDLGTCKSGVNCFHYEWKIGNWSSCILPYGAVCGEGKRRRATWCIRHDGLYVDMIKCIKNVELFTEQIEMSCYVDCPIDCEVSNWSEWDVRDCQQCGLKKQMIRSRHVIQSPSERGQPCLQPLIQHKPCPFNPCYHWNIGSWSNCLLKGADCGYGIRIRIVQCIREDNVLVPNRFCLLVNWTNTITKKVDINWIASAYDQKDSEECHIPCSGDCQMGEWSPWSHCHRDCLLAEVVGYQTRSRTIHLFPTKPESEQCSNNFWETRPCWNGPCLTFSWQIKNGDLKCVRSDGTVVFGGCRHVAKPCHPPCRGPALTCNATTGACQCASKGLDECANMDSNRTKSEEIPLKYYPDDNETNVWMYAMITVGTLFVIFVMVTMYLMCHSTIRQHLVNVRRQGSVRRRVHTPPEDSSTCTRSCTYVE